MATNPLTQLVKTSSGLKEVTGEDLSTRASSLGLPTNPTNPLSAAAIGANPDQAKMAGTAANKESAMRELADPSKSLSTFQRTKQDKLESSDPAQDRLNSLTQAALGFSGSLSDRTEALKAKAFQTAAVTLKPTVNQDKWNAAKPSSVSAAQWSLASQALSRFAEGKATSQDFIEVSKALGKAQVKAEDLTPFIAGGEKQIADAIASAAPDKISTKQLLSDAEMQTVSELLNLTKEEIEKLSVQDLQKTVDQVVDSEFRDAQVLLASAFDPNASPAERATAKNLLRESGTTGQRMLEDRMAELGQDVEDATTITVAGKEVSLEDAFKDEAIQGLVKRYFEEPGFKESLKSSEPELFAAIQAQEQEFKKFSDTLPAQLKDYTVALENNKKANQVQGGRTIPDNVMSLIVPDWGKSQIAAYKLPKVFETLNNPALASQAQVVENSMKELSTIFPDIVKTIANYSYDELKKAGLTTPEGAESFRRNVVTKKITESASPKASPALYLQQVFGADEAALMEQLKKARNMVASGIASRDAVNLMSILDNNKDGKMDDLDDVNKRVKSYLGNYSDPRIIGELGSPNPMDLLNRISNTTPGGMYTWLAPILKDGKFSDEDLINAVGTSGENRSFAELKELQRNYNTPVVEKIIEAKKMDEATRAVFNNSAIAAKKDMVMLAATNRLPLLSGASLNIGQRAEEITRIRDTINFLTSQQNLVPEAKSVVLRAINNLTTNLNAYENAQQKAIAGTSAAAGKALQEVADLGVSMANWLKGK